MYWVLYTSSIQHKDREHGEKGKLSPEIRHILALAPLSLQRTPQSSLCAGDGASLTPPAEAGSSGRRAGTSFMSELSAGNAPSLLGSPALPAAPSAALNKFSPLGGEKSPTGHLFIWRVCLSAGVWLTCVWGRGRRGWWRRVRGGATGAETRRLGVGVGCRLLGWRKKTKQHQDVFRGKQENYIMLHGCSFWSFFNTGTSLVVVDKVSLFNHGRLTFGLHRLLSRVELTADVHQPSLQLHLLLQSELFPRLSSTVLTRCRQKTRTSMSWRTLTKDQLTQLIHFLPNVLWGSLTVRLSGFLPQTRHDVSLQLPQRRRLQRLEVYLNLLGVGVSERRLTGLDDVNDTAELFAGQLVDVQAELALLVVRHRRRLLLFVWVKMAHEGIVGHLRDDVGLFGSVGGKQGVFNKIKMCTMQSTHKLSSRWQHSLALVVFLARCLLHRHHGAGHTLALRFWSFGHFRGLGRPDRCHILLYPPVLLFLNLFLLLFVLLVFLLLGFGDGALGECGELLMNSF